MKPWQFFMLASFIFGAPRVSPWLGTLMQALCLVAAVVFAILELRK